MSDDYWVGGGFALLGVSVSCIINMAIFGDAAEISTVAASSLILGLLFLLFGLRG